MVLFPSHPFIHASFVTPITPLSLQTLHRLLMVLLLTLIPFLPTTKKGRVEDMTQISFSDTNFLALLLDDLLSFCSFISSHPLPFAYLLFFSPYLLQLLSFLSPLLLSTSLLLLVLLTVSPHFINDHPPPPSPSHEFFGNMFHMALDILKAKLEGDATIGLFEPFGSMVLAIIGDDQSSFQEPISQAFLGGVLEWKLEDMGKLYSPSSLVYEIGGNPIKLGSENFKEHELLVSHCGIGSQGTTFKAEPEPINRAAEGIASKAVKNREILSSDPNGFKRETGLLTDKVGENPIKSTFEKRNGNMHKATESLERFGSGRREKEWKRTLACKLFEERMTYKLYEERKVVDGGEQMDLLWEAYEADTGKANKAKNKGTTNGREEKHKEEEDNEEEEEPVVHLCCLQALRLSAGKMNLGVGKPNLVKISKVLKGMGLFQRSGKRGRKG